jgi:allantoicase
MISNLLIDTCHFKGNYPDTCLLEGCNITDTDDELIDNSGISWQTILPRTKLQADHAHVFEKELISKGPYTHVRLSIFPDGGISRLRVFGTLA